MCRITLHGIIMKINEGIVEDRRAYEKMRKCGWTSKDELRDKSKNVRPRIKRYLREELKRVREEASHQPHKLKITGSSPVPATNRV